MLPKIDTPMYELTLPSNNQTIQYRPFLIKEEKILLMAQEGEDQDEQIRAVKQIITNCILTPVNVDKLATFDIEWLFVNISCLLYTSPSPRDALTSRMPSSA